MKKMLPYIAMVSTFGLLILLVQDRAAVFSLRHLLADVSGSQSDTIDISQDLVSLGIAPKNILPNDPGIDAGPPLAAAIAYASAHGASIVTMPTGDYYFSSAAGGSQLLVNGINKVLIEGNNSNFIFGNRKSSGITIRNSSNVTVQDLSLDYGNDLPFTTAIVKSADAASKTITIDSVRGRPLAELDNTGSNSIRIFVLRKGDQVHGLATARLAVMPGTPLGNTLSVMASPPISKALLADTFSQIKPGDILSISERSYGGYNALNFISYPPAISSGNSARNIKIYSSPALGLAALWQNNFSASSIVVEPKPDREQYVSSNADGINVTDGENGDSIADSSVTMSGDDGISLATNLYGTVTDVSPDGTAITVAQRYQLVAGQAITLSDPDTLAQFPPETISDVTALPVVPGQLKQARVTLGTPLTSLKKGSYVFLVPAEGQSVGTVISGNSIRKSYARGIYLSGVTGASVLSNLVEDTTSSGILVQQLIEMPAGFKSPTNSNITIQGNTVRNAFAQGVAGEPGAIGVSTQAAGLSVQSFNSHIVIRNNSASIARGAGTAHHAEIALSNIDGCTLTGNTISMEILFRENTLNCKSSSAVSVPQRDDIAAATPPEPAPAAIPAPTVVPISVAPIAVAPEPAPAATGFWSFIPFISTTPKAPATITPAAPVTPASRSSKGGKKSYTVIDAEYRLNGVLVHTATNFPDGWNISTAALQDGGYTLATLFHYADGSIDTQSSSFTVDNTPSIVERAIAFVRGLLGKL